MRRIDRIKKIILEQIKPEDCQVVFDHDNGMSGQYLFYDKIAQVRCGNKNNKSYKKHGEYLILYILLHEICHHITWKKEWNIPSPMVGNWAAGERKFRRGSKYLCEYRAERMVRTICKKRGWHEMLAASNETIGDLRKHLPYDKLSTNYLWGWDYAFKRINREEKLGC
jgi:hypothetical protein